MSARQDRGGTCAARGHGKRPVVASAWVCSMSPFTIAVLAVSMSVDAFAVSVGRGAALGRPRFSEALRTGAVFGIVEAITPVIGWIAGVAASGMVEAVDHWIAFTLLAAVGLHMLYAAIWAKGDDKPV